MNEIKIISQDCTEIICIPIHFLFVNESYVNYIHSLSYREIAYKLRLNAEENADKNRILKC